MNFTKVEFHFENVECGTIPSDIIEDMQFDDLHEDKHQGFEDGNIVFTNYLVADNCLIKLDYELANQYFTNFDGPLGKRLCEHDDIVDVTLHFADNTQERIKIAWSDNSDDDNEWQSHQLEVKKPLDKSDLDQIEPGLAEEMKEIEQNDRFLNRKILRIYIGKED